MFTNMMMGIAAPLAALAVIFLVVGLWDVLLGKYFSEVKEERTTFLQGLQKVLLRRLGVFNRRFMWPSYEAKRHKDLVKAGEPANLKPEEIMAMQQIGFVFFTLFGLLVLNMLGVTLLYSLLFGLAGLYYPLMWLGDQVKKRHHLITRALPYNLDLLTLSVEAGLDFTGALGKVVEKGKSGPLKDEFALVLKQLKMGKTREEALKMLIARVDLPSLSSFVTSLIQADRMGTSIGKVLRIQSTQLRIERSQKAEKLANEAPVKMLFPLIACIFPTVFLVLFGPIVFAFTFGDATK
jgi:tight adherence protein C